MSGTQKKVVVLSSLAVTAVAVALLVTFALRESEPEINLPKTVEEGIQTLATPDFAKLPEYRQDAYRKEIHRLITALPESERLALIAKHRNNPVMQKGFVQLRFNPLKLATDEYYQAPPDKRTEMIDRFINRMEAVRKLGGALRGIRGLGGVVGAGSGGGSAGNVPGPPGLNNDQRKAIFRQRFESQIQNGDPQDTARMTDFFKHVQQRRIERGLPEL